MKRIWLLKVIGICLFALAALFLVCQGTARASGIELDFEDDEYADEAQYITWEIKATETYKVIVYLRDDNGDRYTIVFITADDEGDTKAKTDSYEIKIGKDYFDDDPSIETFEADKSFEQLTVAYGSSKHYLTTVDQDAEVEKIEIIGDAFKLYYIGLANDSSFNNMYWELDVGDEDIDDADEFDEVGGDYDASDTLVQFYNSYIAVSELSSTTWNPYLPYGYTYSGTYPYMYSGAYPYSSGAYGMSGYPYGTNYAMGYGSPYGGSMYGSPYGGGMYGSPYGGGMYGGSMYGSPYGGSMYGSPYGGSMYGSPYGGSMYGSQYGGSMYGSPYGGSMYGSPYGGSMYGSQFGSMYGGTPFGAGIPGLASGLGTLGAGFAPMGLPIPPAGLGLGLGFDPFGFGLGLTGMGAFDPFSIAAFASGMPGLGLGLGLGFGLF